MAGTVQAERPPEAPPTPDISGLLARIRLYDPKADIGMVEAAFQLAAVAHRTQKRDNGDPYITHPVAVAEILAGYRLDSGSIVTALLHDVIEDTGVSRGELERRFGAEIAGLVDGVTKLTRLELQSDRTKQAENFRKLVLAMSRDIRVLLVKLADRLHNMRTLQFVSQDSRRLRIARETMDIYAPLAERIGMDAVKTELQTLAFAQLEPEAYETIQARLNFLRGQGADVIEEVRGELAHICRETGVEPVEVSGREKSPFSIWEKMQRRNVQFEQLSDIMAFRLLVPTREACYTVLGAVHAAYQVIAGRFKDYISTPKANGYRSLHTGVTLREPRNQKIEVQIRTPEMHDIAENGVAAHWIYKQHDAAAAEAQRFHWVQDLLEILDDSTPDEFLENTKLELYQDQVFCFTPKGQLIQLPRGATPIDFAYAVHSQVGDTCVGAKINGRLFARRHAEPAMGALRRHRQGARAHPAVRAAAAAPAIPRQWQERAGKGFPAGRGRRLGESSRVGPQVAQDGWSGRSLRGGRQGRYRRARGRAGDLSGVAAGRAGAAHAADPAEPCAPAGLRQGAADQRVGFRHGDPLRRLLPSAAGRPHHRHHHHRQRRDHPHPRVSDAGELRGHARAVHRGGLGAGRLRPGRPRQG